MEGISYINNRDIFTIYNAELIGSSFENLITPAGRKEGAENNMVSHPGVQVFNDNIQPEAREVELTFLIRGRSLSEYLLKYNALIDAIDNEAEGGNFSLTIAPLRTTYKLRRKSFLSLDTITGNTGKLIVTVRELNPKDRILL